MVKRSKSSDFSENLLQFFKLYIPGKCSQRLRFPPAFVKYSMGFPISKSVLKTSHSETASWCVDIDKVDNFLFLGKGWPEFVSDNSLEFGDFLVFYYTGDSNFRVCIFGKNNCPKDFSVINTQNDDKQRPFLQCNRTGEHSKAKMPNRKNIGIPRSALKFGSMKPFLETVLKPSNVKYGQLRIPVDFVKSYMSAHRRIATLKHSNKKWHVKLICRGRKQRAFSLGWKKFIADNTLREGDICSFQLIGKYEYVFNVAITRGSEIRIKTRASSSREEGMLKEKRGQRKDGRRKFGADIENASSEFISNHPFFRITMSPTYVSYDFLNIPQSFRRRYLYKNRATVTLQRSNKWWEVNLRRGHDVFRFSSGWGKFATEHSLQVGDVCTFELINRTNYVFKVSVTRAVDPSTN